MSIFTLTGAALVGIGMYGMITSRHLLRQILAFNIIGSGIFLLLGALGRNGESDPVPHALIITGIVVALSATALAVMLALRLHEDTGDTTLPNGHDGDG
ncbi:MAG: cation:proton antiporter subunit C [Sphingomonadaceae bacterium]